MTTTVEVTRLRGLTEQEAARRLAEIGPNTIPEPARASVADRVVDQLRDPMIMLLVAAAVLAMSLRDVTDTVVVVVVVVLNTAVGVLQELRAERALAALRRLSAPTARVLRDGRRDIRPAAEVVPGDVVFVEAGDIVPADGRLLEAHQLQADEAALTGESVPVDKNADKNADKDTAASGLATVSAGTVVTRGRGVVQVTRTGLDSGLGRIAALLGEQKPRPTPLQRRLSALGWVLASAALALSAVVMVSGLLRGRPVAEMVLTGVSLAVAAVPESLPAVVALALALGAHRMARRAAVIRRLPAVETLGSVTVVAADKTGTLTEGRMTVERAWTPADGHVTFTGTGYEPFGAVRPHPRHGLLRLLRDAVLCNDADLRPPDADHPDWGAVGDPTEAALVVAAAKAGVDAAAAREDFVRCAEVPFDSATRRMTTVHRCPGSHHRLVVCKGAPEVLLGTPDLLVPGPEVERAREVAAHLAAQGHRVLAVADRLADDRLGGLADDRLGGLADDRFSGLADETAGGWLEPTGCQDPAATWPRLRLTGLVAISDPAAPRRRAGRVGVSRGRGGTTDDHR